MHFYKHNIGDYRRDTSHLTLLEHGAYRQLLDTYYLHEEPIPDDDEAICRRLCARTEEEKCAVLDMLREFFARTPEGYVHRRCDMEIREYQAKAETARANGKAGGRPKKTDPVISGNPEKSESKANHEPVTKNQEPEEKTPKASALFPDVDPAVVKDFLTVRRSLRAPVTERAAQGIRREAAKAGITIEQALILCVERSWRGFNADWVLRDKPKSGFDLDAELKGAI